MSRKQGPKQGQGLSLSSKDGATGHGKRSATRLIHSSALDEDQPGPTASPERSRWRETNY
ncbi:hypothetical protein CCMA1212_008673 [Trichoderma ghanense]|uniref:Uncharacterized protein n=1 Tax=Trichoderma ghanense TaxID=65468 RepID=A0ABY2GV37_9HYPO